MIRDKPVPPRQPDPAFDNFDELRTVEEMNDILADRHRVKMNSLMSEFNLIFLNFELFVKNIQIQFLSSRARPRTKASRCLLLHSFPRSCLCRFDFCQKKT